MLQKSKEFTSFFWVGIFGRSLAVVFLLGAAGLGGCAGPPKHEGGAGPDGFDRLDQNGDGRVTLGEFRGDEALFRRLDRNQDGELTRGEFTPRRPGPLPEGSPRSGD
ncbi:MAG TPA: hypothetical protein VLB09_04955 [Nitrospiria bacterium]|nr:hypothetical protein [Nitrospiria bacterium]